MSYTENNINLFLNGYKTPKEADVYFNPKMAFNRELVLATLQYLVQTSDRAIECFDAFSATGMCAMQWKKNLKDKVAVYASDIRQECIDQMKENCSLNGIKATELSISEVNYGEKCLGKIEGISVIKANADIIMRMQGFDFIHLDPFGSTAPHLESAMKNIRKDGILVLTSTDVASLLSRNPDTVMRNYGAKVIKTQYKKELSARTVIAAAASMAARCNKGIKVLLSIVDMDFTFIALKIERGCKNADQSLSNVTELLHCRVCEERGWYPASQLAPLDDPYSALLTCDCHLTNVGRTGVKIGPFWCADIIDNYFIRALICAPNFPDYSNKFRTTLTSIENELNSFICAENNDKSIISLPSFYFFPNHINVFVHVPKFDDIIALFKDKGFIASRTYIEPSAIRTNARMNQIKEICKKWNNVNQ